MTDPDKKTYFGFEQVSLDEKTQRVTGVFNSVAEKYDLMNDLMSLGIHRLWKRFTIEQSGVTLGSKVLDIAGGTGDLSIRFQQRVGDKGLVVLADINYAMLEVGRDRLLDKGYTNEIQFLQANAEDLPFADNSFDCVCISFGLRNVADKDKALRSFYRVIKPGGRLLVLEFSQPTAPGLKPVYDFYSFQILPRIGEVVANDKASYQYLADSIRTHPDQETLKEMILTAGFDHCDYFNLTGGIVALHRGFKY